MICRSTTAARCPRTRCGHAPSPPMPMIRAARSTSRPAAMRWARGGARAMSESAPRPVGTDLANAPRDATGIRLNSTPLRHQDVSPALEAAGRVPALFPEQVQVGNGAPHARSRRPAARPAPIRPGSAHRPCAATPWGPAQGEIPDLRPARRRKPQDVGWGWSFAHSRTKPRHCAGHAIGPGRFHVKPTKPSCLAIIRRATARK